MTMMQEAFDIIARAFIKECWVKRADAPEVVAEMKRLLPDWPGNTEPHYPGAITHFVEDVDINGTPTVFAVRIAPLKQK